MELGDKLRRLHDPDAQALYERCFLKAEYWADPERWTDEQIADAGIALDRMVHSVNAYIHKPEGHRPRRRV